MHFADNWARVFVVMTFLVLEAANTYCSQAEIVGRILSNFIALGWFLGSIGYFLFTGPLFGKGQKDG